MKSSAMRWTLPPVATTSDSNVKASNARTPSTTSKKDGFRDDPGARMLERKSFSDDGVCWDVSLSESLSAAGSSIADVMQYRSHNNVSDRRGGTAPGTRQPGIPDRASSLELQVFNLPRKGRHLKSFSAPAAA